MTKSSMTTDVIKQNPGVWNEEEEEKSIEHVVTIVCNKHDGDNKRAFDDITATTMFGEKYRIAITQTCPDTLLAVPILCDLVRLSALMVSKGVTKSEEAIRTLSFYLKQPCCRDSHVNFSDAWDAIVEFLMS